MEELDNGLEKTLNKYKLPIAIIAVGIVLLVGGIISSGIIPKTFIKSSKSLGSESAPVNNTLSLKVDVSGAVVNPGVYTLPSGARIEDAIRAAGGVKESADPAYMSKAINLAQKISDGMKIYIPASQDKFNFGESATPFASNIASSGTSLVNVNEASLSELDVLPGVGPVTAQNIVDKRPYSGVEELLTKKAVTRSTYDKIKEMVSVY